jgi:hypothetical protein
LRGERRYAALLRFLTAGSVLLATAGAVRIVEMPWSMGAAILTLIPIAYLIEGMLRKDDVDVSIAYTAFGFFSASAFLAVCHQGIDLFIPHPGKVATLGTAIVALEATVFLLMAACRSERLRNAVASHALSVGAAGTLAIMLWQGLGYLGAGAAYTVPAFATAAVVALAVSRMSHRRSLARPTLVLEPFSVSRVITAASEPVLAIPSADGGEGRAEGIPDRFGATGCGGSQLSFDLRPHALDRVEVGTVRRQEPKLGSCRMNGTSCRSVLMSTQVVEHDDVSRTKHRSQHPLGKRGERRSVAGAFKRERCRHAVLADRRDYRDRLPAGVWHRLLHADASRCPTVRARQVGADARFVEEHQVTTAAADMGEPPTRSRDRYVFSILFRRMQRLFLRT